MSEKTITDWADEVHALASAKGWHEEGTSDARTPQFVANIHGECSELWEAYRKGALRSPCDKAGKMVEPLTCLEEELADIVIRAFDTAKALGVDIERAVSVKHAFNASRPYRHGGKVA